MTGGGGGSKSGSLWAPSKSSKKKYSEDEYINYLKKVGKLPTSPIVLRGMVAKILKSNPSMDMDEMLIRVKRQL